MYVLGRFLIFGWQNESTMAPDGSGMLPDHSQTFLGYFFLKSVTRKKMLLSLCVETLFAKVDLVWQLWPIRLRQNTRTLILFLSYFRQNLRFWDKQIAFCLKMLAATLVVRTFSCWALVDVIPEEHKSALLSRMVTWVIISRMVKWVVIGGSMGD